MFKRFLLVLSFVYIFSGYAVFAHELGKTTEYQLGITTANEIIGELGQPDYFEQRGKVILAQYCQGDSNLKATYQAYVFLDMVLTDTAIYEEKNAFDCKVYFRRGNKLFLPNIIELGGWYKVTRSY